MVNVLVNTMLEGPKNSTVYIVHTDKEGVQIIMSPTLLHAGFRNPLFMNNRRGCELKLCCLHGPLVGYIKRTKVHPVFEQDSSR